LIDSGAQYEDGTTDVTRIHGSASQRREMRDRFTRVLRGHMAIARAVFPDAPPAAQLDSLARQFLWQAGLDFEHGTGTASAAILSVHEGPARISKARYHGAEARHDPLHEPAITRPTLWHPDRESGARHRHDVAGAEKPVNAFER